MAIQTIKCGGFVAEEIQKVNANFAEIEGNYAKKTELPSVPTNVSAFTNDAGYAKTSELPTVPTNVSSFTNDANYVNQTQLNQAMNGISVPTKTSDLNNDSGFVTEAEMNTALGGYVEAETGKGLSTNDYTTDEKNKLAGLSAPSKVTFTTANWSNGTYTTPANGKMPTMVMRKNGSNYESVLVDVKVEGTNVVITSDDAFEGYVVLI